jgi:hypothetical protein
MNGDERNMKMMNNKAQFNPLGQNKEPGIFSWFENNPIILIILLIVILVAVLWSIQYITCHSGFGACIKVLCFWGKGLC